MCGCLSGLWETPTMEKNTTATAIREMRMNSSKTSAVAVFARDRRNNIITTLSFGEARGRSFARTHRQLGPGESALRRTSEVNQTCGTRNAIAEIHRSGWPFARLPLIRRERNYHSVPAPRTKNLVIALP